MKHCTTLDTDKQPKVACANLTVSQFLAPFYPDEDEQICFRFLQGKGGYPEFRKNYETTRRKLSTDKSVQNYLKKINRNNGIYFVVNSGGQTDVSITRFNAVFAEIDDKHGLAIPDQHRVFDTAPLPSSIRQETRHSVHCYWLLRSSCSRSDWREIQQRVINFFDADPANSNESRIMRLPFFNHLEWGLQPKQILPVQFCPERSYSLAELMGAFPALPEVKKSVAVARQTSPTVDKATLRLSTGVQRYQILNQHILENGIKTKAGSASIKCPLHPGQSMTSLFAYPNGVVKCWTCETSREKLDEICKALNVPIIEPWMAAYDWKINHGVSNRV